MCKVQIQMVLLVGVRCWALVPHNYSCPWTMATTPFGGGWGYVSGYSHAFWNLFLCIGVQNKLSRGQRDKIQQFMTIAGAKYCPVSNLTVCYVGLCIPGLSRLLFLSLLLLTSNCSSPSSSIHSLHPVLRGSPFGTRGMGFAIFFTSALSLSKSLSVFW